MLDQGTTAHDKYAIAQKLDEIGARIDFSVGGVMLEFRGKCLRKDLPVVMALLAEQLRTPAFSEEEFAKLKKQMLGDLQRALESTDYRASQAFAQAVFPPGHPNYQPPTKEMMAAIEAAKIEDVKAFHSNHYGPARATLVVVGDIEVEGCGSAKWGKPSRIGRAAWRCLISPAPRPRRKSARRRSRWRTSRT